MNNELDRTMLIKVIIVEDSRLARLELTELLKAFPEIEIINEADNISKAQRIIETLKPDLIFLDINMPGGNGFELLESLKNCPEVIFTTAYDEYAVKAFEYNALDYLLKPINTNRLAQAIGKIKNKMNVVHSLEDPNKLKRLGRLVQQCPCWPLAQSMNNAWMQPVRRLNYLPRSREGPI